MTLPSGDHLIYIPVILVIGFVLGFVFGRKSLIRQMQERRALVKRRKERRAMAEDATGESSPDEEKPSEDV